MGQSLNKIYVHLVFSTKYRKPLITDSIKDELFSYLGGICKNLECNPIQVGGYKNHVHILCLLSKKIALMDLLEKVKSILQNGLKPKVPSLQIFIGKTVTEHFRSIQQR